MPLDILDQWNNHENRVEQLDHLRNVLDSWTRWAHGHDVPPDQLAAGAALLARFGQSSAPGVDDVEATVREWARGRPRPHPHTDCGGRHVGRASISGSGDGRRPGVPGTSWTDRHVSNSLSSKFRVAVFSVTARRMASPNPSASASISIVIRTLAPGAWASRSTTSSAMSAMSRVQRAASSRGGATDWELLQLWQKDFPNTEFWLGGQRVPRPFG